MNISSIHWIHSLHGIERINKYTRKGFSPLQNQYESFKCVYYTLIEIKSVRVPSIGDGTGSLYSIYKKEASK